MFFFFAKKHNIADHQKEKNKKQKETKQTKQTNKQTNKQNIYCFTEDQPIKQIKEEIENVAHQQRNLVTD